MINSEHIILLGALAIFAGIMAGKIGYRLGIPALLLFLFTGMAFGSSGLGIQFEDAGMAQFVGIIALSIILFAGGMDTRMREIRPVIWQGLSLSTVGVVLTTAFTGLFIWGLSLGGYAPFSFSLPLALLLAATMSSTDSASVFAILRSQKMQLKEHLKPTLELESGSNDPMAYMLTLALIQYVSGSGGGAGLIVANVALQFVLGLGMGYALGRFAVWILNHINIDNDMLYPIVLLCVVFFTYSATTIAGGNGYLAIYVAGIVVGNSKVVHKKSIATVFEGLTWLVQIILFILLGLLVNPNELVGIAVFALLVGLFLIVLGRPLAVFLSLLPFRKYSLRGRLYLSWVGLRGAVPIIFATYPMLLAIPDAKPLFNIVFFITILSLLIQGSTVSLVAGWLHLDIPSEAEGNLFGVEFPEETGTQMEERAVTRQMLAHGNKLMDLDLKDEELVILVSTDDAYRVPKGAMSLKVGDVLLIVSETSKGKRNRTPAEKAQRKKREQNKRIAHRFKAFLKKD